MRLVVGSDHAGFALKGTLLDHLRSLGHDITDVGCYDANPVDFPDIARNVAQSITGGQAQRGLMVCGTGVGAAHEGGGLRAPLGGVRHDQGRNFRCGRTGGRSGFGQGNRFSARSDASHVH